jgi:carbamoyltransferase
MPADPPLVLGFNSTHDAAAAIVSGGDVVMAVEEERLSRVKHHFGMPRRAMELCLQAAEASWETLEHVAFYMNPTLWLRSSGWHFVRHLPRSASYLGRKPALWESFFGIERRFRRETGFRGRFHVVDHHAAHIDSAFWPSGFEEAAALSIDGAGEAATTVRARVDARGQQRFGVARYPVSVGKVWEAVTDWLGWTATQDEGKTMGLAPYGSDRVVEAFARVLRPDPERGFFQDLAYTDLQYGSRRLVSDRFVAEFGPAREPGGAIEDHHRDVARALQVQTEEVVLAIGRKLHQETGLRRLVMAGGVALNCVANGRLLQEGPFDEVFVQPAAGDNGACLGAALFVAHRKLGAPRGPRQGHAFLGPGFDEAEVARAAAARGLVAEHPEDVVAATADLLAEGAVVGWMQGRMEYGPRALGHRSILADPRRDDMTAEVNRRVKFREPFRPFAPSVTWEAASDWFVGARPSPYMLLAFEVRPERRDRIPAVTHVDGTARVQTVTATEAPRYHALLTAFGERTGVPVLLNTSFNIRGEPIVRTPAEALEALVRTGLNAVVIGDHIFRAEA